MPSAAVEPLRQAGHKARSVDVNYHMEIWISVFIDLGEDCYLSRQQQSPRPFNDLARRLGLGQANLFR